MTVALQIRDVPEEVRDVLAKRAAAAGESLQKYLLNVVLREAGQYRNVDLLRRLQPTTRLSAQDVAGQLDADRSDRGGQIEGAAE